MNDSPQCLRSLATPGLFPLALAAGCRDGNDNNRPDTSNLQGCADTGTCASNPPLVIGGEEGIELPVWLRD